MLRWRTSWWWEGKAASHTSQALLRPAPDVLSEDDNEDRLTRCAVEEAGPVWALLPRSRWLEVPDAAAAAADFLSSERVARGNGFLPSATFL